MRPSSAASSRRSRRSACSASRAPRRDQLGYRWVAPMILAPSALLCEPGEVRAGEMVVMSDLRSAHARQLGRLFRKLDERCGDRLFVAALGRIEPPSCQPRSSSRRRKTWRPISLDGSSDRLLTPPCSPSAAPAAMRAPLVEPVELLGIDPHRTSGGDRPAVDKARKSGSQLTHRWREVDSNHRSPSRDCRRSERFTQRS
jgi:hypothetical protein